MKTFQELAGALKTPPDYLLDKMKFPAAEDGQLIETIFGPYRYDATAGAWYVFYGTKEEFDMWRRLPKGINAYL